ncbi:MAG: bifunctional oligoribonuclease/PAP phosphatase NrnA [Lachnospiraceae bacterium]|nr:bifunctional oligoribonuclease/PAP phosphatase NrnA [Lachnospiraceae bacterium]
MSQIIDNAKSIAISGHLRPDGDCIGSCMAVYNYLKDVYGDTLNVKVYFEVIPEQFAFINRMKEAILWKDAVAGDIPAVDLFIILDSSDSDRLGILEPMFRKAKRTFCIDHHISNTDYADDSVVLADASSASEIVYQLLDESKISLACAEAIYLGIVHDSGAFKYSNTSEKTMQIAGKLLTKGVEGSRIIDETFYEKTYIQNQILGRALLESVLFMDKKCIFSVIKRSQMDFYGVTGVDLGGIVEQLRLTAGVECAVFLYEIADMEYKISMRSKRVVDVSKIATYFGGGGHVRAAGFQMKGTVHDVLNNISKHIEEQLYPKEEA